jgi:cold shock CspA family protein
VKFFKDEKGWGGIESNQIPGDVWVIWSVIDGTGYRNLTPGEEVEFLYERQLAVSSDVGPATEPAWRSIGHISGSEDSDRQLTLHHSRWRAGQRVGECPGQV